MAFELEGRTIFPNSRAAFTMKQKNGFTLVEVMLTIVVLGVLLAVAVAAYQDYVTRARISEADSLTVTSKLALGEACGADRLDSSTNATLGLPVATAFATPKVVTSITAEGSSATDASITVVLKEFGGVSAGDKLVYKGTCARASMAWVIDSTSTVPAKFRPRI